MKVAIIGAGVAGLCSLRYLSENFPEATIDAFEATDSIGGNWVYNRNIDYDEFNLPVMTSMYQNLRANLPKITMELPDFPIPEHYKEFMDHDDYLDYLKNYTKHFNLNKHIKFRHYVTRVQKTPEWWEVECDDLRTQRKVTGQYDYVYVCSGHYHQSFTPEIKGMEIYKGRRMHSHTYRKPEDFKDKTVLIVGCGPSGLDLSIDISKYSKQVYLSHHMPRLNQLLTHVIHKPDIREYTEDRVIFQDGSSEEIDDIIYCTGYNYYFPFLDKSCGMNFQRTHIKYLYNQIINVEHPSMFFIGIPIHCCAIVIRDFQVRYTISLMKGNFILPSKQEMLDIYQKKDDERVKLGKRESYLHDLITDEDDYYRQLSIESGIKRVPTVFHNIRLHIVKSGLYAFRSMKYTVVDDENFYTTRIDEQPPGQPPAPAPAS